MKLTEKTVGTTIVLIGLIWMGLSLVQYPSTAQDRPESSMSDSKAQAVERDGMKPCKVLSVYDGDTFACDLNQNHRIDKKREMVRLLGVDSPEMHYSQKNKTHDTDHETDEPWAKESSQWLDRTAFGKIVYLEFDRRKHDRYGRLLAYVYLLPDDTETLNEKLLETGYARTLFIGSNRRYEERFIDVETRAREKHAGMWGDPSVKPMSDSDAEKAD